MVKGQFSEEKSLLRRELSISNYSSCCCWTFSLFNCHLAHCPLVLKGTEYASGIGLGIWKSRPHIQL